MEKVAAIKDLANSMSMWSMFGGGIKIDMGELDVKGAIKLKSEDSESTTKWINDPIFVSKLKDVIFEDMEAGQNGGKN